MEEDIISNSYTGNSFSFIDDDLTRELFINGLDIYKPKECYLELGIPNIYCRKYFDDEDFIYARLKIQQPEDNSDDAMNLSVINYISTYNIIIDFTEKTLDAHKIYAKVLYLYQFVNSYYSSLSSMRPLERIKYMPVDLLTWIDNIVETMRYILDNDLFNFKDYDRHNELNTKIETEYFEELIYGLNLTICHLKMVLNHYRVLGIPIYNMEEKHIKKMFQVLNNMCVITIYLKNVL